MSGQLLETYPNARIAAEAMNTSQQYLSIAARGNKKVLTACGYVWRRGTEPELDLKPMLKEKWLGCSPLAKQQHIIGQYDLEGNLVNTYTNTVAASKAVGVHKKGIRDVIKGRGITYGGYIWRNYIKKKIQVDPKIKDKRIISQYDLNGRWLRSFKSTLEAGRVTGIDNSNISYALNGVTITAGGYLWRKGQQLRVNIAELRKHPRFPSSVLEKHMKEKRKKTLSDKVPKEEQEQNAG